MKSNWERPEHGYTVSEGEAGAYRLSRFRWAKVRACPEQLNRSMQSPEQLGTSIPISRRGYHEMGLSSRYTLRTITSSQYSRAILVDISIPDAEAMALRRELNVCLSVLSWRGFPFSCIADRRFHTGCCSQLSPRGRRLEFFCGRGIDEGRYASQLNTS